MANKIEIFENTLLKLLIRRGLDADRQNIVLTEGELGYTTDTKKLYVGDGQTTGGIKVGGNSFLGSLANITTLAGADIGDTAFSTNDNNLYTFNGGDITNISNWSEIGGVYGSGDGTIVISGTNNITVGSISAANITGDVVGASLTLSTTNKITLSSQIAVNAIIPATGTTLTLPGSLTINNLTYNWPGAGGIQSASYLKADIAGNLSWSPFMDIQTSQFVYSSAGIIPVGSIMPFISSANAPSGWLLCNGQSVAGASYPELSAVIGTTFGGNSTNFNVPNLINKTLYGVSNSPATSTLYSLASGTNSALSATGALYIIKAKPDGVLNTSLTVTTPLCATINGINLTNTAFNPLSGNLQISLVPTLTSTTAQTGPFVADVYGRVTSAPVDPAGTSYTPGPGTRPVHNGSCSPIGFFRTPATIISGSTDSIAFTISAYPFLTTYGGLCAGAPNLYSVPPNAKNLIVESYIDRKQNSNSVQVRLIASAPNESLLNITEYSTIGATEYYVNYLKTFDENDDVSSFSQVFLPLSANASGDLTIAFRINDSLNTDVYAIRAIGYTL